MQKSAVKSSNCEESPEDIPLIERNGNASSQSQEAADNNLFVMSAPERQRLLDDLFEVVDLKYGEALRNLAK